MHRRHGMIQRSPSLIHATHHRSTSSWNAPVRRWHELHGVRERKDSKCSLVDTLQESVWDSADEFVAPECHFTGLDNVANGGGPKKDGVVVGVVRRWVEVAIGVWEGLAEIDVYADRLASGILV